MAPKKTAPKETPKANATLGRDDQEGTKGSTFIAFIRARSYSIPEERRKLKTGNIPIDSGVVEEDIEEIRFDHDEPCHSNPGQDMQEGFEPPHPTLPSQRRLLLWTEESRRTIWIQVDCFDGL